MARNRTTGEEMAEHFDSLPRGAGSPEERVAATARYFKVTPAAIHRHLKFWWSGKKYLEEFGSTTRKPKWDRPTAELLKVLNDQGSVSKAAKLLGVSRPTLYDLAEEHGIPIRVRGLPHDETGGRAR